MELNRRYNDMQEGTRWRWSSGQLKEACPAKWVWPPVGTKSEKSSPWGGSLRALNIVERTDLDSDEAWPQTEGELAVFYHKQIMDAQNRHLEPLREDLADWLNKILG